MMITPVSQPLSSTVVVPGSKSHTNRALILAALAGGQTTLTNALFSDDSHYLAQALDLLGFPVSLDQEAKTIAVIGFNGTIPTQEADLFVGNAGTAARFLTAMLTAGKGRYSLDGSTRMRERPIGDMVTSLNNLGALVTGVGSTPDDPRMLCPPLIIHANGLPGGRTSICGDLSSQFLSGLLMVAPLAQRPVTIDVLGTLHSKPYIDLTLAVMSDFGVRVERDDYKRFTISPQKYTSPGIYTIESDASAASYFFAAPAICGGSVEVRNISGDSRQGDIAFLDVLSQMGCTVVENESGTQVTGPEQLRGVDVDMSNISDTAMTLAAIAPFADSPTTIRGIESSRVKESDRVSAAVNELRRLGVDVAEHRDGMTIQPCAHFRPACIRTYDDHRIAMAFSLVGLRVPGITIENPECVGKTFPEYFRVLESLR